MKTMDKILIILGITAALFIITSFIFVWQGKSLPDSLIYSFFGALGGEGFIMGWIKNRKEQKNDK